MPLALLVNVTKGRNLGVGPFSVHTGHVEKEVTCVGVEVLVKMFGRVHRKSGPICLEPPF